MACVVYGRTDPALVALLPQEELIAEEVKAATCHCHCSAATNPLPMRRRQSAR